jgi:hypothetical protein
MTPTEIRSEIEESWNLSFEKHGFEPSHDPDFNKFIDRHERTQQREAKLHLQPWLCLLEQSTQWLAQLFLLFEERNDGRQRSKLELSVWALLGASTTYCLAVRRLVLSGLENPARAAARSLDEHLCTCLALLHDSALAEGFQQTHQAEEAEKFWYENLNTKALRKYLNSLERELGLEATVSQDMRAWRHHEIKTFSQSTHPTYIGCVTSIYAFDTVKPDQVRPAVLGRATAASHRTLNYACKALDYFCVLSTSLIFSQHNGRTALLPFDKNDPAHQMIIVGRDVIPALNIKYWNYKASVLLEPE